MHVELNLVLEALKSTQDGNTVTNFDVLVVEPVTQVLLPTRRSFASTVVEVVQPKNAANNSGRVVDSEEMLIFLFYVVDYCSSYLHFGEKPLIA